MEFKKIKKVINKIYNEETQKAKKEIKSICEFVEAGYSWDRYKTKTGEILSFGERLTERQHTKPIAEQKRILQNKVLNKKSNKFLNKLKYIELLETSPKIKRLEITVNYTNGSIYGTQAQADIYADDGNGWELYKGAKTGGCGYDKESTTTADALNQIRPLFVLIAERLEKLPQKQIYDYLTRKNGREFLGYGFDFWGGKIGSFSGGVGFSCHEDILKNLKMKETTRHFGKNENFYIFEY
jgi:hypothetical protein